MGSISMRAMTITGNKEHGTTYFPHDHPSSFNNLLIIYCPIQLIGLYYLPLVFFPPLFTPPFNNLLVAHNLTTSLLLYNPPRTFHCPRFVLSALGLFSAAPGSADLVLGSPLFKHVRVWRGVCDGSGSGSSGVGSGTEANKQGSDGSGTGSSGNSNNKGSDVKPRCDYSLPPPSSTSSSSAAAANPPIDPHATHPFPDATGGGADPHHPFTFPPASSYLDIVALGTSPVVSKVVGVTFNGVPVSSDRYIIYFVLLN